MEYSGKYSTTLIRRVSKSKQKIKGKCTAILAQNDKRRVRQPSIHVVNPAGCVPRRSCWRWVHPAIPSERVSLTSWSLPPPPRHHPHQALTMASTASTSSLTSSPSAPSPFTFALLPAANAVGPEPALSNLQSRARFSQVCSIPPQPPHPARSPQTRPRRARRQAVISDADRRVRIRRPLSHILETRTA